MFVVSVGLTAVLIVTIILVMPLQRGLETNLICKSQIGLRRNPSLGAGQATMIAGSRWAPDKPPQTATADKVLRVLYGSMI